MQDFKAEGERYRNELQRFYDIITNTTNNVSQLKQKLEDLDEDCLKNGYQKCNALYDQLLLKIWEGERNYLVIRKELKTCERYIPLHYQNDGINSIKGKTLVEVNILKTYLECARPLQSTLITQVKEVEILYRNSILKLDKVKE